MKKWIGFSIIAVTIWACTSQSRAVASSGIKGVSSEKLGTKDIVRIANDSLEYEVLIIDPGFNTWFQTNAKPRGFYSQSFLETRNIPWVIQWNINYRSGLGRNGLLYQSEIDYRQGTEYGYEVNYMLFNYLTYFQLANNVRLGGPLPRI